MITPDTRLIPEPTVEEAAEKEISRRVSFSHHGAHAAGFAEAAQMAREQAAKLFIDGKDGSATLMRSFAVLLDDKSQESRNRQSEYRKP